MLLVDLETLVQPIPGDDPAGAPVSYLVRAQLEEARKATEANGDVTSEAAAQTRRVDWLAIIRLTQDILSTKSKDLLVAARLTEALTNQHGFAGLAEGLVLLRRLIHEAWDRIHPTIEDGDLEVRAAPFNWLAEADRGARFPVTVRSVPLVPGTGPSCTWLNWKRSQEGRDGVARPEAFDQVVKPVSRLDAFRATQEIELAVKECSALLEVLNEKMGEATPSMEGLSLALSDCLGLAQHVLTLKGGPPVDEVAQGTGPGSDASMPENGGHAASANDLRRAVLARNDVYRRLTEVGEELRILEPHSPVPVLIRKAVAWGSLSFPELIRTMSQEEGLMSMLSKDAETGTEEGMLQDS
jgi:type VI secretion system protein ImpA